MRAILAGLFVYLATIMVVGYFNSLYPDDTWPWWTKFVIIATMLGTLFLSMYVFNKSGFRPSLKSQSTEDVIAELDEKELLVSENFKARRCFQLEEYEDEGSHYYIELEDGSTLYLNGQYLYDYEEIIDDEPEFNQSRRFPCTDFTILRHKVADYVIDIICGGQVLEPEILAPAFSKEILKQRCFPVDGEIITDRTYDDIKRERLKL